jgi:hypothetical protein
MTLDIWKEKGKSLEQQELEWNWKDMVGQPFSKLDDDAFTRVRVILMNGIESEALRFQHVLGRSSRELRLPLSLVRLIEQQQQTAVNWLNPADQSPLETTIGYEQVAIEVTAAIAEKEPDPYLAQVYRFGLLEDFDHMYRYAALMDRVEGKDPSNLVQGYTDLLPGRPTSLEHRAPEDDLRHPYDRKTAAPLSKLHAMTLVSGEYQTHDFYMTVGPTYADPIGRLLYAEIASIEEQHVTQYESMMDPDETFLEKWLLHEANEVYNYYSAYESESNARIKAIWERFCAYELGLLHFVADLMRTFEKRDPEELLPSTLPEPIAYVSHREMVRQVLRDEVSLTARGPDFVPMADVRSDEASPKYREQLNAQGSPSEIVAAGYQWRPGTELTSKANGKRTQQPEGRA